jgi:threonine/homoserine/homoserine lactone efflux protein
MSSGLVLDLLPIAAAVALSPIPIVAVVLVLGSPAARRSGPAFALGWVLGLTAVSVIVVFVLGGASDPASDTAHAVNWGKVGLGALFLAMAARQWRKRPKEGEETEMPKWMAGVDSMTPGRALVLGAALSGANPKNLALTLTAAASIAQAGLSDADELLAVAIFVLLGSITVAGSVLFFVVDATRAARPLAWIKAFMTKNNATIMSIVLLVLGVKVLLDGVRGPR